MTIAAVIGRNDAQVATVGALADQMTHLGFCLGIRGKALLARAAVTNKPSPKVGQISEGDHKSLISLLGARVARDEFYGFVGHGAAALRHDASADAAFDNLVAWVVHDARRRNTWKINRPCWT